MTQPEQKDEFNPNQVEFKVPLRDSKQHIVVCLVSARRSPSSQESSFIFDSIDPGSTDIQILEDQGQNLERLRVAAAAAFEAQDKMLDKGGLPS